MDALTLAEQLLFYDLAPIPITAGTKRAAIPWKQYQDAAPLAAQLPLMFSQENLTVGIICGRASENLLISDCDSMDRYHELDERMGHPETWAVKTARGAHLYFRTPFPVYSTRVPGIDLKAQGSYVLAPGATHPSGAQYEFLRQPSSILEISLIDFPFPLSPLQPRALPNLAWKVLNGFNQGYDSRSEAEAAAITALVNAGWTFERVRTAFEKYGTLTKYSEMAHEDKMNAVRWLRLTYDRVSDFAKAHDSPVVQGIRQRQVWAMNSQWPGRTGAYDRAVYLAHLEIAEHAGKVRYGASVRELAEYAGINEGTACRASHRLEQSKLLSIAVKAVFTFSTVWELEQPFAPICNTPTTPNVRECCITARTDREKDAFRRTGLGKYGEQVWQALNAGHREMSTGEIAEQTGRGRNTIVRALNKMLDKGMVEKTGTGNLTRWQAKVIDLEQVAFLFGTSGLGARQKEKYRRERTEFKKVLLHKT